MGLPFSVLSHPLCSLTHPLFPLIASLPFPLLSFPLPNLSSKLVNCAQPGTIDERVINDKKGKLVLSRFEISENIQLALHSARGVGCKARGCEARGRRCRCGAACVRLLDCCWGSPYNSLESTQAQAHMASSLPPSSFL